MLPTGRRITYHDLTRESELALLTRFQAGDRAAGGVLIQAHEPVIYDVVRPYFGKGLDIDDVMQAGRYGFFMAMRRFDVASGNRLTTYAADYAKGYAQKAVSDHASTIRVGRTVNNQIRECRKAGVEIPERIQQYLLLRKSVSLSTPVDGGDVELGDLIAAREPGPDASAEADDAQSRRAELVQRALTWLNAREREIVQRRMADEPESYEAIGASMGFSKQRTEQIMKRTMVKLDRALRRLVKMDDWMLWGAKGPLRPLAEAGRVESVAP